MLIPTIKIHADAIRDIADLIALGSSSVEEIAHKENIDIQIENVADALSTLNRIGKDYHKEEVEIAKRVEESFIKNADKYTDVTQETIFELGQAREEMLLKTQVYKEYWKANDKLKNELEKLVAVERFGILAETVDQYTKDQIYMHLVEERAGLISGMSEFSEEKVKIKKMLGRDRLFAINSAATVIKLILSFVKIAQDDNYVKKKYDNHDLELLAENEEANSLFWLRIPTSYVFEIEIPNKSASESLLERLDLTQNLSIRAKVITFRKALKEKRNLHFLLEACDKKCQFSLGELDTVLQSISRFNAKIKKRNALRSGENKSQ